MLSAGIDVGQHAIKVVLLEQNIVLAYQNMVTEVDADTGARQALENTLKEANTSFDRIQRIVSTGLGRKEVSFSHLQRTQETCAARGAYLVLGKACTVLDGGAGGCRAVKVGHGGKVLDFASNSKCASGTGSFLQVACEVLQIDLAKLDMLAGQADGIAKVSTTCAVFAESAIISNVHRGFSIEDICAGICDSVATRLLEVLSRAGIEKDVFFCGGVAQSKTITRTLERRLGATIHVPTYPLLTTALGAALCIS